MRAWLRRRLDLVCGSLRLPGGALLIHPDDRPTLLDALRDAICYRQHADCADCAVCWPCPDLVADAARADSYGALRRRLQGGPRRRRRNRFDHLQDAMAHAETTHAARETN